MLSPTHAIVGSTNTAAIVSLYTAFGFELRRRTPVPADVARALYGLDHETHETVMAVPGAARGWLKIVDTPVAASHAEPFDAGPHAIDLYTTDMEASIRLAEREGARCGPIVEYRVGPLAIREAKTIVGPDRLVTVFIEAGRRRPSVLDRDTARLHSEIHSVVWTVASADEAVGFWRDRAQLELLLDVTVREPAVARLMSLPREDAPLRLAVLADRSAAPVRLEFIEFTEDAGSALATWPLRGGLFALGCAVDDLSGAMTAADWASFGTPIPAAGGVAGAPARALPATAAGGMRVELWEEL